MSLIDYLCVSGSIDVNVLECVRSPSSFLGFLSFPGFQWKLNSIVQRYVDHLHENFEFPCSINADGHYNVSFCESEAFYNPLTGFLELGSYQRGRRLFDRD